MVAVHVPSKVVILFLMIHNNAPIKLDDALH